MANIKKTKTRKMATRQTAKATQQRVGINGSTGKIMIAVSAFLLLITVAVVAYQSGVFNVETQQQADLMPIRVVEIDGTLDHVSKDEILELLLSSTDKAFIGDEKIADTNSKEIGFFSTDLLLIEQKLETIPWLQKAELRRVWPDRLQIKVKEQKAIARWNEDSLINVYGEIFTPKTIDDSLGLPMLTGPRQELKKLLDTFTELQLLLEAAELQLEVLNLNHRYSWSLVLSNGIELQVGRTHLIERVERFIALYPLLQKESKLPIAKIDLRYDTGLAVTRLETSELQASL